MKIALVMRSGGDFNHTHVAMIARQLTGYDVVCLTDKAPAHPLPGVEYWPLSGVLTGWWSKLELFAPWNFKPGERIVYFDLDTVIIHEPSALFEWRGTFAALEDLWNPGRMASGVMAWEAGPAVWPIWETACIAGHDGAHVAQVRGTDWTPVQRIEPGVCSFKPVARDHHTWRRTLDGSESVVCFHGQPRPWDVADEIKWLTPYVRGV